MATSYTGLRVQDTYNAIIKIGDNSNLTGTPKLLSDGLGNDSPLYLSGTRLGIGISPAYQFHTSGNAKIGGNLIISGNLTVNGTLSYLNVEDLAVEDPIIKLAKDNTANTLDIGLFGKYVATGTKYKGFFNDASDDKFKLFIGTTVEPTTTVDTSATGYTKGNLVIGNLEATNGDFSDTVYIDDHLEIENSSGYGYIELGGSSGGYIDLKGPFSNDFDLRVFTDGTNSQINAIAGALDITANSGIDLQYQGSNKLTVTSTGIDITGNLFVSGGIKDSDGDLGSSGQLLSSTGTGTNWIDFESDVAKRLEITVKNVSGGSLAKGVVVHAAPTATPPSGNVIEVVAADANVAASMPAIGVLNETIADEAEGEAVMFGAVSGIDTSSFTSGDELYVSETAGEFTATKPTAFTSQVQKIAVVLKSHASNGSIKVFGAGRSNDVPNRVDRDMNFTDSSTLSLGTGEDLFLIHDDTNSIIGNTTGNLIIRNDADDSDIIFQSDNGSGGRDNYLTIDGGVERIFVDKLMRLGDDVQLRLGDNNDLRLYHNSTSGNNNIENHAGSLYITNYSDDEDIVFRNDNGSGDVVEYFRLDGSTSTIPFGRSPHIVDNLKLYFGNDTANDASIKWDSTASQLFIDGVSKFLDNVYFTSNAYFGDSDKLYFGDLTTPDLEIYHDGTNSYIKDTGTGDLRIWGDNVNIGTASGNKVFFNNSGVAELYYTGGVKKLETTSTGVSVTGNGVFSGNVSLADNKYLSIGTDSGDAFNTSSAIRIQDSSHVYIQMKAGTNSQAGVLIGDVDDDYVGGFLYHNGTGALTFKQNNVDALTIGGTQAATFEGNVLAKNRLTVGQNTVNGAYGLYAAGSFGVGGNATIETGINLESGVLVIKNATSDSSGLRIFQDSSDASKIYNNFNGTLQLGVGNTTAITIDSSENTTFAGEVTLYAETQYLNFKKASTADVLASIISETDAGTGGKIRILTKRNGDTAINALTLDDNQNATFAGEVTATEYNLPSSGMLDWANGDARIVEGLVNNYSLSFQTWDGSAVSTALRLDGDNKATFAGEVLIASGEYLSWGTSGASSIEGSTVSNKLQFRTNSANAMIIDSSGDLTIQGGRIYLKESDLGNTAIALTRDADEGYVQLFSSGTQTVQIRGNGDSYLNGGKVGIGTTSPDYNLEIESASSPAIATKDTTNNVITKMFSANSQGFVGTESNHDLRIRTHNTDKITIQSGGNVGIGTTSPSSYNASARNLVVYSTGNTGITIASNNTSSDGTIRFADGTGGTAGYRGSIQYSHNGDHMRFYTSATERVRIKGNGNVGIGTTSPTSLLHLQSASSPSIRLVDTTNTNILLVYAQNSDSHIGTYSNHPLVFDTNSTERMRINSSGAVGIGTNSPTARLDILTNSASGDNSIDRHVRFRADNGEQRFNFFVGRSGNSANLSIYNSSEVIGAFISSDNDSYFNGGDVGINDTSPSYKLDVNGTIRATGDVIAYSDRRVKDNIETIENGLEKVTKLRGVSYTRNDIEDDTTKIGVIAQEVLEVLPEVVKQDDRGKYSVSYGNMAGVFIEAIKELKAEVDSLKQEIKELKK
jgi:hypothetical protein